MTDDPRSHPFRDSQQDMAAADRIPDTAQTRAPSYRLAFADPEFLTRDELRPVRLQLELLKPQMAMDAYGVVSTIVLFGGARIPAVAGPETPPAMAALVASLLQPIARPMSVSDIYLAQQRTTFCKNWKYENRETVHFDFNKVNRAKNGYGQWSKKGQVTPMPDLPSICLDTW